MKIHLNIYQARTINKTVPPDPTTGKNEEGNGNEVSDGKEQPDGGKDTEQVQENNGYNKMPKELNHGQDVYHDTEEICFNDFDAEITFQHSRNIKRKELKISIDNFANEFKGNGFWELQNKHKTFQRVCWNFWMIETEKQHRNNFGSLNAYAQRSNV